MATCLKIYPGVLLVFLLLRHRRAFIAAALTCAVVLGLTIVLCGHQSLVEHARTVRFVADTYIPYRMNISLAGALTRAFGPGDADLARLASAVLSLVLLGGAAWIAHRRAGGHPREAQDLDTVYALFLALVPILSPVSWDHYEVLLLFPLAVVGRLALTGPAREASVLRFLGLLALLALPDTTFGFGAEWLRSWGNRPALDATWLSLRTALMIAIVLRLMASAANEADLADGTAEVRPYSISGGMQPS
jgi:hypothetical protein